MTKHGYINRIGVLWFHVMSVNGSSPFLSQLSVPAATAWVVTPAEQLKYDEIFRQNDLDKDGLLSGTEIKNIFLQSGVPQAVLAHIW